MTGDLNGYAHVICSEISTSIIFRNLQVVRIPNKLLQESGESFCNFVINHCFSHTYVLSQKQSKCGKKYLPMPSFLEIRNSRACPVIKKVLIALLTHSHIFLTKAKIWKDFWSVLLP